MLYNKNNVRKINDKKVLHKIGKHWATISIAVLAMIGGGAAVSATHASANTNTQQVAPYYGPEVGTNNVATKSATVSAAPQYSNNNISGASSASVSFGNATNHNASKVANDSITDINNDGVNASTNAPYKLSTSDVNYTNPSIGGTVHVDTNGNVTATDGAKPVINYGSAFLTAQGVAKDSLEASVSGSNSSMNITLNPAYASDNAYSLGATTDLAGSLVAPSGYSLTSTKSNGGGDTPSLKLENTGSLSNDNYTFTLASTGVVSANSSAESAAKTASASASSAYSAITSNGQGANLHDVSSASVNVSTDYTNASNSASGASSAVVSDESSSANTSGQGALASISDANVNGSIVSSAASALNSNAAVLSNNVSILNSLAQNYGSLNSGVDNNSAISAVAQSWIDSSAVEKATIQQASNNASSAMSSVASANALSSSANSAISAATKNNPSLSYDNEVSTANSNAVNESSVANSASTDASNQSSNALESLNSASDAVSNENSYAKASNSASASSESVVASKAIASADANAQSASNDYINASKAASMMSDNATNISKVSSLAHRSGFAATYTNTASNDLNTASTNANNIQADYEVASTYASDADKLNGTTPNKPANSSDVTFANVFGGSNASIHVTTDYMSNGSVSSTSPSTSEQLSADGFQPKVSNGSLELTAPSGEAFDNASGANTYEVVTNAPANNTKEVEAGEPEPENFAFGANGSIHTVSIKADQMIGGIKLTLTKAAGTPSVTKDRNTIHYINNNNVLKTVNARSHEGVSARQAIDGQVPSGYKVYQNVDDHVPFKANGGVLTVRVVKVAPAKTRNTIHYINNNDVLKTVNARSHEGVSARQAIDGQVPSGYKVYQNVDDHVPFKADGGVLTVRVVPKTNPSANDKVTDTVNFLLDNDESIGSKAFNDESKDGATVTVDAPNGYKLVKGQQSSNVSANDQSATVTFPAGETAEDVLVAPTSAPTRVNHGSANYTFVPGDSGYNGPMNGQVNFNNDNSPVGTVTAPEGYYIVTNDNNSYKYDISNDGSTAYVNVPAGVNNRNYDIDLAKANNNVQRDYEAKLTFVNPKNVLNGRTLSLRYTGNGAPKDIPTADLTDLSAHNLAINVDHSDIKSANDLTRGLKGFRYPNQVIHFTNTDDATGGFSSNLDFNNDVNLAQDYDLQVSFVDEEGNRVINSNDETVPAYNAADNSEKTGDGYIVDFGHNNPSNGDLSLSDLVANGTVKLPDGYSLGNDDNNAALRKVADFDASSNLSVGDAASKNISNNGVAHVIVCLTHNQSTQTNGYNAAAKYYTVDNLGFTHAIGDTQSVNTAATNNPNDVVGQRAISNSPATNFMNRTNVNVPAGYVVAPSNYSGDSLKDFNLNNYLTDGANPTLKGMNSNVQFEKFSNPATTAVYVVPAQEANITLKDAATGQIVKKSVPVTFGANTQSSVNGYNGNNNMLGLPYGYKLAGDNYLSDGNNGFLNNNGNSVDGLAANDVLDTTGSAIDDSSVHDKKVPDSTVLVYKSNASTDHAAIQFQTTNGKDIGTPVVVDTGKVYNQNQGPELGNLLQNHNIIPSGYQLLSDDEDNHGVNYGETEEPDVTDIQIAPKSTNNFEAAIQFQSNGQNVGLPVMVNTNSTNNYGVPADFGNFASQYGIKAPANYSIVPGQENTPVSTDKVTGANGNNVTVINVTPNSAATSDNGNTDNSADNNNTKPVKHDVNSTDVDNAAKNDSKLQTALNNWNAKNGHTKEDAQALVNAINANNALNNDSNDLDDIINGINNTINNGGLTPQQRLAKLSKLYSMYTALVNTGIFNN